jgi:hypothetical protein
MGRTSMAVEAGTKKEQARNMDSVTVGEAVGVVSRWTRRRSGRAVWTRRRLGRRSVQCRGSYGGGAGARCGPDGRQGDGRWRCGSGHRGGVGAQVAGEMIVVRVRI